ncbi:MAG: Cys-tRNA(Pro) deacylase [Chromatiaceae bacterium]|nr:Cys-tRNA(Pro) deacylase [Chromatiaceae bacterium]
MTKHKQSVTTAVRTLRQAGVPFTEHPYDYVDGGGTARFASETGVDEHLVLKTLVMEDEKGQPLIVLMHGDRQVSTKALARQIGAKSIQPCAPKTAERHSGYQVGGTSPFGTRRAMPVYCEASVAALPRIYVNGGRRGYIVSMETSELIRVLKPRMVKAARERVGSAHHCLTV